MAVLLFSFGLLHQQNSLSQLLMLGQLFGGVSQQFCVRKTLRRASGLLRRNTRRTSAGVEAC